MNGAVRNRFVDVQVAVANLEIKTAIRVGTDPRLVVDRRPLTAEIGQWHKVTCLALLAIGKA